MALPPHALGPRGLLPHPQEGLAVGGGSWVGGLREARSLESVPPPRPAPVRGPGWGTGTTGQ